MLDKLNKDRDFEHMVSPEHMFQGRMKPPPPLNVKLFGPMTMPGEDPRIRKPTSSPRMDDPYTFKYCFKYMAKARDEMDEFFEQSDDMDEALWKATDEAEKVYVDDMDAEMWRGSDEAEHNSKERHPSPLSSSPSLLLSSTLTLTLTITISGGPRGIAQGHSREDQERHLESREGLLRQGGGKKACYDALARD